MEGQQQPYPPYSFDIDMMKRSMDPSSAPDSKKARWSPTGTSRPAAAADLYANYGYAPAAQAQHAQAAAAGTHQSTVTGSPQIYATPQLSINTALNGNNAAAQQQQQQQQQQAPSPVVGSPYNAFNPYGMLGMYAQANAQGQQSFGGAAQGVAGGYSPQRLPTLNIPAAQAVYGNPAALSALSALQSPLTGMVDFTGGANRTVYIGNLPPSASVDELLNLVHFGPLESIRVLPEKSCVFLSFLDAPTASAFYADALVRKLTLHTQELKVGWGKPSAVPAQVMQAITQSGASRNVYLGALDENMTEEMLRDELSRFGLIDQVKIVRDKNIGFVHFLSIGVATKVVNTLPTDPAWAGKRVNYGKDRCAYVPKSQQAAAHQAQAAAAQSLVGGFGGFGGQMASPIVGANAFASPLVTTQQTPFGGNGPSAAAYANSPASAHPSGAGVNPFTGSANGAGGGANGTSPGAQPQGSPNAGYYTPAPFSPDALSAMMGMGMFGGMGMGGMMSPMSPGGLNMMGGLPGMGMAGGNRTVYLGNIHPETTTEDLCNAIRGGVLQSIRYMADKHIAFITFIDPAAAFTFFQVSSYQGLTLNNRRLKIGWGKNSGPLPPTLALAVHAGATRNVYIGNVEDFEVFSEERLKTDFGEFGDIELVNFLKEKNCAFVNFTNISNAIKAIESIKNRPEYANLRIAHGKDRCANPPRSGPQGSGGARRNASGNGPASAEPVSAVEHEGELDFDVEAVQAEAERADATADGIKQEDGATASS
ncbi:negative regulator of differentiation 1 [Favolaschia claudopus]|uniref:Negative regulator of differentiation 1 n=1 Tax=Favolaschia claudopus TaxID=2862362 RepID=A0AAW0DYG4_9AGAR